MNRVLNWTSWELSYILGEILWTIQLCIFFHGKTILHVIIILFIQIYMYIFNVGSALSIQFLFSLWFWAESIN
jgi:hypothetical protein